LGLVIIFKSKELIIK